MRNDLFAIFTNPADSSWAVDTLLARGAQAKDISTLSRHFGVKDDENPAHHMWNPVDATVEGALRDDRERPGFSGVPSGDLASVVVPTVGTIGGSGPFAMAMLSAVAGSDAEVLEDSIDHHLRKCYLSDDLTQAINDAYCRDETILSICVPSGTLDRETAESILNERGQVIEEPQTSGAPRYGREAL
jgi:hypothetical protein